ncbi:hypothetical protein T492DRAFT_112454 [Pavlovales sp. CCMP2436]|nr:hypothetical protein T492DRAFT_112454 [Pavlovales sp. CCMP2436]
MHELSALLPHPLGAAGMVKAEGSGESSLGVGGALFAQAGGGLEMGQSAAASPRAAALQLHGQLHTSARGAPESSAQSPYQMLLEAVPPHRIMWASLGWLELSGYLLQGVLGNTLAMFAGDATDPRNVAQLMQTMEEQGSEAAATVVHYTKRGRPFQHVLRVEPLRDAGLADIQFVLVTSVLLNPMSAEPPVAKAEAMLPGFVQLGVMQLADALRLGGYGEAGAALAHGVGQANARGAAMPSQGSAAADGMSEQQRQQLMRVSSATAVPPPHPTPTRARPRARDCSHQAYTIPAAPYPSSPARAGHARVADAAAAAAAEPVAAARGAAAPAPAGAAAAPREFDSATGEREPAAARRRDGGEHPGAAAASARRPAARGATLPTAGGRRRRDA